VKILGGIEYGASLKLPHQHCSLAGEHCCRLPHTPTTQVTCTLGNLPSAATSMQFTHQLSPHLVCNISDDVLGLLSSIVGSGLDLPHVLTGSSTALGRLQAVLGVSLCNCMGNMAIDQIGSHGRARSRCWGHAEQHQVQGKCNAAVCWYILHLQCCALRQQLCRSCFLQLLPSYITI
jgi:hypothetical protein